MEYIYLLQHVYDANDCEEIKLIGVFSSSSLAEEVISELHLQPGFKNYPKDWFKLDRLKVDAVEWKEGFISWNDALEDD